MMNKNPDYECPNCHTKMIRQMGTGYLATHSFKPSLEDLREQDHTKKVKDKERATRSRKKAFGHDAVGDPVDKPDPKHIIKGKTLGGQQLEVDKQEFIKAAAKDPCMVKIAKDTLNRNGK